jgi:hypothetical protein
MKSGSLNLLEPSGPHRACDGTPLIYSFLLEAESTQGHNAARRIMSMKSSSYNIEKWTRDLPTSSAVPKPTAPSAEKLGLENMYGNKILDSSVQVTDGVRSQGIRKIRKR